MTKKKDISSWGPRTKAVRTGVNRAFQETSEAMFLTSGYAYDNAEQAAARFTGDDDGFVYSRFSNPTVEMFENRLAQIEGASWCAGTASGMAAVTAALLCQLSAGDHMVASRALFGSCRYVAENLCAQYGITTTFVDGKDLKAWEEAVRPETKVFFLETPSNPGLEVLDIAAIATLSKQAGAKLVIDNVFATPVLQHPLELGADIIIYSATKHIDGQGRVLGGAILGHDEAWRAEVLFPYLRNTGPTMSAFNAWVLGKSLETMDLRVRAMAKGAARVADSLSDHLGKSLKGIKYPFRDDHPQVEIAKQQMEAGGTLITIEFTGEAEEAQSKAFKFLNNLELIDVSNNLGDAKSLATHPRTTTHHRLTEEARLEQGVTPGLVRLSIGLEDPEDLIFDLLNALGHG
ncbi:MAG: O-succinylhomoserine sulfhydrylase [Pseudomonadota bacterium]